jgi:hypothetical protein
MTRKGSSMINFHREDGGETRDRSRRNPLAKYPLSGPHHTMTNHHEGHAMPEVAHSHRVSNSTFPSWQPTYAAHRIATFPVRQDKKPAIKRYSSVGLRGSQQLALKFQDVDAFAFMCGERSRITVLDVDSTDERLLADGIAKHGRTPLVVRTASGKFHAYYKHSGERRCIRPWRDVPIDLLGGGLVVAPPSLTPAGRYEIIQGSLDDLDRLPVIYDLEDELYADWHQPTAPDAKPIAEPSEPSTKRVVPEGQRNNDLYRHLMREAHSCENLSALVNKGQTFNQWYCSLPLSDDEVMRTARSVWDYTIKGKNRFGQFGAWLPLADVDLLVGSRDCPGSAVMQDACLLLTYLRAHNRPDNGFSTFMIANGLADTFHWTIKRLAKARSMLITLEYIRLCRAAVANTPARYSWHDPLSWETRGEREKRRGCILRIGGQI